MKRNTLNSELQLAKELGFEATSKNSKARNPYLLLENDECLFWLAGGLISITNTSIHFGEDLYLTRWKSSNGNEARATVTATQLKPDASGNYTQIYYRRAFRKLIKVVAEELRIPEEQVILDHKNNKRGDNRRVNLRPADAEQNSWNRSTEKVEHAFYTIEDYKAKITSGEWKPLKGDAV